MLWSLEYKEKKKSLHSERKEDHERVVEELFDEETKCRVKRVDRKWNRSAIGFTGIGFF